LWCSEHKTIDMINVKTKKCVGENCEKNPSYNILGEIYGIYCSEHKLPNMIDLVNKFCIYTNFTV